MDTAGNFSSDELIQKTHQRIAAANSHDAAAVAGYFAEDAVVVESGLPEPVQGRPAVQQAAQVIFTALPDLQQTVVTIVAQADMVAAEIHAVGTNTGPLMLPTGQQLPASGNSVELPMALFSRFGPDGLIVEERRYLDTASMMRQLGIGQT